MKREICTYRDLLWYRMCDVIRDTVGKEEWNNTGFAEVLAGLSADLNESIDSDAILAHHMDKLPLPRRYRRTAHWRSGEERV